MTRLLQSFNPADGSLVWKGEADTQQEIERKIDAAKKAFHGWSMLRFEERALYLKKFEERLTHHHEHLAEMISREMGKPLWEAKGEVSSAIQKIAISIAAHLERCPEHEMAIGGHSLQVGYRPHGTVAVFGPFNFPIHLPNGHLVPALLAGNSVIFKPSEKTAGSGEALYRCLMEAMLPEGVVQIVQGGKEQGQFLAQNPKINGLFFTGSLETGMELHKMFAAHPEKILSLELGGNNPLVVTSFEDPMACSYLVIQSAFLTSGQRCSAARRLILTRSSANERLLDLLVDCASRMQVGAFDSSPEPFMGPLVDRLAAKNVLNRYKDLVNGGAKVLLPMKNEPSDSAFLSPTILDVTKVPKRPDIEIFGPLLQVVFVDDFEEAVEQANHTRFGLSAGLVSKDPFEWNYFRKNVRAGIVNRNTPLTGASSKAPFGGIGMSGNHRPSAYLAADYCSYPVSSLVSEQIAMPNNPLPGITP